MSDTKLPRQFPSPAVQFWYILQCIEHCQRGRVVMKGITVTQTGPGTGFGHPGQSNPWCDPTTPPGEVWLQLGVSKSSPYRHLPGPHSWPAASLNCHSLEQPLSFHPVFKARAQQSLGSVSHTPLCRASTILSILPQLQWKVSARLLSRKCLHLFTTQRGLMLHFTFSQLCHQTTGAQNLFFYSMPPQTHWYQEPVSTITSRNFKS